VIVFGKQLNGKVIIGDPKLFSLEERIFNTVCVIAFVTMCFEVPFNFVIGLMVPAGLCIFGVLFSGFLYYLSRIKRRSVLGIKLFSFVCNFIFIINYFFNSGIFGPNLLLFSLAFLLIIAIIPKTEFKFWIAVNVLTVVSILTIEYFYPEFAPSVYESKLTKVIDFAITYFVVIALTYFAISYIRKNYDFEKKVVLQKSAAIEYQRLQLERLNSEKDKLLSIVTHDIRTPLSAVQGYLELLTEVDLDEMERLDINTQLLQTTRNTTAMLTNVLSWTKTQMEGAHVHLTQFRVIEVLTDDLTIERNIAVKKGVRFEIFCEPQLHILADRNMLQLVLRNLVNNAIKFTPKGGLVKISAVEDGEKCCVMVRDTGIGIGPAQQEKLFQLNVTSTYGTNKEKGIGLGLLLCKEFTVMQDGEIWYEANEDLGSTFFLSFKLSN